MNLEQLLSTKNPEDWEGLSDEELERLLKPYFLVTRPKKEIKKVEITSGKGRGYQSVAKSLIAEVAALTKKYENQKKAE